ncbi:protein SOB FIVE-LIKE 5 isoform X2 [Ziziphus jujuba]|uniref:Protein SOB FIVE-LIKE 5 isoform X2 n=1 Tax=Ziziphus jujuba TaxID=326968 RepID=A0A6P3Z755_ZIZJJ|nr:protein SOB FIVE-LIKE 5 isoform X2 [Ziziphus jujuba]
MNISASECTSRCESGWTLYLDQSSISETQYQRDHGVLNYGKKGGVEVEEEEEEEEQDLSMVSDASSGPPHYHEDDEACFCEYGYSYSASGSAKKVKKNKMKEKCKNEQYSYLADTASSPVSKRKMKLSRNGALMENVTGYSESFSATHFKGKSALEKHFNFHSSLAKNSGSEEPGDFHGRNWE